MIGRAKKGGGGEREKEVDREGWRERGVPKLSFNAHVKYAKSTKGVDSAWLTSGV